ncbi:hypothetical protein [Edaphobacter sp.]|uniref:hypothetical protein n=1 Tax=Edaphobacter sp. TaxID=1934404 RepID=UPI002DB8546B|nr:hypothetical protein [Edaphobacter sp.]HEU5340666.1 hypothetical protein [Edaphobacter sp.]
MEQTQQDQPKDQPKRYQCRHIFTDGHRCGSASLRNQDFCYYHHTTRPPAANPRSRKGRRGAFALPLPEDRSAIQASIGQVLLRIASNEIDPRRAGLLLYGLQIAVRNLPKEQHIQPEDEKPHEAIVEQIEIHPELGPLAPQAEAPHPRRLTRQYILEGKIRDVDAREQELYRKEEALRESEREFRIRKMKEETQSARTLQPPTPRPLILPNSHPGTAILPEVNAVADNPDHPTPTPQMPCSRVTHGLQYEFNRGGHWSRFVEQRNLPSGWRS